MLIGGGFHGKSTLFDALAKGVYPHIPGDGRERVVTLAEAVLVCTENGRAVNGLDISGFIDKFPAGADAKEFWTKNASGSTSEAVQAGAQFLLIDEDSSVTNLLIKDRNMRKLIPKDTITPLFDRVRELFQGFGVSTLIVIGGSSDYLEVAEQVIALRYYLPVFMTDQVRRLVLAEPEKLAKPLMLEDRRRVRAGSFDPSYLAERLDKTVAVRPDIISLIERELAGG